ncbi:ferredoxin [Actinopolymorpha alba]|uniref:ferredoxin n=1 Tax=Actinopolymorpha alba TaxID=533267 RepID=UPI0003690929|nr:ferredoxin [Actinopolymorpha alba]
MRIEIHRERCIGAGMCVLTAPDLFDQSEDDGCVVLLNPEPAPDRHEAAKQAESLCPSGTIEVVPDED